jgi:UDP-N-acetyl-alpha-D-muramoyl-L-alanyl-L-glutamate epimerase
MGQELDEDRMTLPPATDERMRTERRARFRYDGFDIDAARGELTCHYSVGPARFAERFGFPPGGDWSTPAARFAASWVCLLAGVSYFKTSAPGVIDLGPLATTADERAFLGDFYRQGLGEFAFRNGLDLSELDLRGPDLPARPALESPRRGGRRPLVPFGGGIDSAVTVEEVRGHGVNVTLLVVQRPGAHFTAIEAPAAVSGLPIARVERTIDPRLLRSAELGYLNGHVPVTGIISAVAVLAAVLFGHDAVVMSNERSASVGSAVGPGPLVNHQYSKGLAFEEGLRRVLRPAFGTSLEYFSLLRPYSELWVAERFARLPRYHPVFRSCNGAFRLDPARRLDDWCGRCDKCCFIDLILAPFLPRSALEAIFAGREPLGDPGLTERFAALLGRPGAVKPFECVGDVDECVAAAHLAAERVDRTACALLQTLAAGLRSDGVDVDPATLLRPTGVHFVPDAYAPQDLLA